MRKRVLIFSFTYYPSFIGGAEVAVKEITDRLGNSGYDFDMITIGDGGPKIDKIGNVSVYRVGRLSSFGKYLFIPQAFIKALFLHQENKYDALWSIMANYAGFSALFFKLFHPKIPFILTLQEGDPISHIKRRVRFVYPFFILIFKKANIIQTISNYLADFAKDMGATCPILVIPNGVDLNHFSIINSLEIEKIKRVLEKESGDTFLITTSRLVAKNGVKDIVKAMTLLPNNYKLIIAGIGPLEDKIRRQIKELNLDFRVKMIGFLSHKDIPNYLRASDIFIRPSLSEGLGNSFLEAMACGIPVIATPVGGIPDFLKDNITGLFCKVENLESIKEKVEKLMMDRIFRESLVKNALEMAKSFYDWKLISESMDKAIFREIFKSNIRP